MLRDCAAQRTRTILFVETFAQEQLAYIVTDLQGDAALTQARAHLGQQQVEDRVELFFTQRMEDHNLVDTVDELWPEDALQPVQHLGAHSFVLLITRTLPFRLQEADLRSAFEVGATSITSHNHHG